MVTVEGSSLKLTNSQKRYLILLKAGNLLRVDDDAKNVKIRGYDLRIQYNTIQKFKELGLITVDARFNRADQPAIRYYTISELGIRMLEDSFK